jgi:hypothetical protein
VALPPLADPHDLTDYPGGPFPERIVRAASASVRADCHWHIAPVISETVTVDGTPGPLLLLPTLRLVSVTAVRVLHRGGWTAVTDWRIAQAGMLYRTGGWYYGPAGVQVEMTHGYTETPHELIPVIAARCQRTMANSILTQRSETVGTRTASESYNVNRLQLAAGVESLSGYRIPPRLA